MPPRFAMISEGEFRRLKAPAQIELVEEAIAAFPEVGPPNAKNPSYRWAQVKQAYELWWGIRQSRPEKITPRRGILPAPDVNEWLRSLPPVPLAGEGRTDA